MLTALEDELNTDEIDDEVRVHNVLLAYAHLLSCLPAGETVSTNEELYKFFASCKNNDRPGQYIELLTIYCELTECNLEKMADTYLENVLKYINHTDEELVRKVVECINMLFSRLPKETQYSLTTLIREAIEKAGIEFETA